MKDWLEDYINRDKTRLEQPKESLFWIIILTIIISSLGGLVVCGLYIQNIFNR